MKKLFAILIIPFAFVAATFAQATATATATIVTPITITKSGTDLSFGNIMPSATLAGTVAVAPNGSPTYTDVTASLSPTATAAVTAAVFTVTGTPDATYDIGLPAGTITLTGPGGNTMTAGSFVSDPDITAGHLSDPGGTETLRVGATLSVSANQAAGTYISGNFTVTVNYN